MSNSWDKQFEHDSREDKTDTFVNMSVHRVRCEAVC